MNLGKLDATRYNGI